MGIAAPTPTPAPFCEVCVKIFFIIFVLQLTKAHRQGHMVKVDWLDRLTFREIEMINEVGCILFYISKYFLTTILIKNFLTRFIAGIYWGY